MAGVIGYPHALKGLGKSGLLIRKINKPKTVKVVNKVRVNPRYVKTASNEEVKIRINAINDCKMMAITGIPFLFFLAKNFNAAISSPIVIVTLGPASTIELMVEINKIDITNDMIFPPVLPKIFPAERAPISIIGFPWESAISAIGTV